MAIDGETVTSCRPSRSSTSAPARQGVGRIDMVEDRLVGIKSREVYEAPGAIALITAHQELENVTVERELARFKRGVEQRWGELVYDGLWFSPLKRALDAFVDETQKRRHRRRPDDAARRPRGRHRPPLRHAASTTSTWRPTTRATPSTSRQAKGFIEIWGLSSKIAAGRDLRQRPVDRSGRTPTGAAGVSLWGGRFAGGPADALAALSKSTHFDWRLAPHDIAGSRAHARVLHAAGLLDDATLAAMLDGLDRLRRATCAAAPSCPAEGDEDVHTALERGLIERAGADARRPAARRPLPQRPDRHAVPDVPARARPRWSPGWSSTSSTRWSRRPAGTSTWPMPGRTHLQHAQPVLLAHHLLAHAWAAAARRRAAAGLGRAARRCSPYGSGALAGSSLGPRPGGGRRRARASPARWRTPSTAPPSRDFVAEFAFVAAMIGGRRLAARRGGHPLGDQGVLLRHPRRRLLHRVEHHAAEEEPRRRRARARQGGAAGRRPRPGC